MASTLLWEAESMSRRHTDTSLLTDVTGSKLSLLTIKLKLLKNRG